MKINAFGINSRNTFRDRYDFPTTSSLSFNLSATHNSDQFPTSRRSVNYLTAQMQLYLEW